ncbi:MAG: 30S ribosomal protein S14 [Bacteroidetes bacterium]|nr:30S ribosomal protein S14 [Bacteroidota bacterium]MBL6962547.1 30S ribosomal protein S14 [Bacteroidota bacterium]
MSKLSITIRNRKRKEMVAKYAEKRAALKAAGDYAALDRLPKNASPVRVRNRCQISGRPRAYSRQFGISRNLFREMAHQGLIPGVKKSSW